MVAPGQYMFDDPNCVNPTTNVKSPIFTIYRGRILDIRCPSSTKMPSASSLDTAHCTKKRSKVSTMSSNSTATQTSAMSYEVDVVVIVCTVGLVAVVFVFVVVIIFLNRKPRLPEISDAWQPPPFTDRAETTDNEST